METPMLRFLFSAITTLLVWTASANADWSHLGGDPAHTSIAETVPPLLDNIVWTAMPQSTPTLLEEFIWRSGVVATNDRVIITARHYEDDGFGSFDQTTNRAIAIDTADGMREWETPIDADVFGYDSISTPAIDTLSNTVLVASHFSLYAIAMSDGHVVWECQLPHVLVDASPTVSDDLTVGGIPANRVFMTDYTGFGETGGGIYAINTSPFNAAANPYQPGEIVWQDHTLPGTAGNTVAYADGYAYVSSTGGIIRRYEAICGGVCGMPVDYDWETDTGVAEIDPFAGFYSGVAIRHGYVYAASYSFFGSGNNGTLVKLVAQTGAIVWVQPCERTDAIPIVTNDGMIYLSAGIEGFGSAVKIQAFRDDGAMATPLWDTYVDSDGSLVAGGWTHQPLWAGGRLYCGVPDSTAFFGPYVEMVILDTTKSPDDATFIVDRDSSGGGNPAVVGSRLYSLGTQGLVAYEGDLRGDLNCDHAVNVEDIMPFVLAQIDPAAYDLQYDCNAERADMNDDDRNDGNDIAGFVASVLGT